MHRTGHYGAALLVYSPLAFLAAALDATGITLLGGVAAAALSMLPDYDQRIPGVKHRGATHTVHFAGVVGFALAIVGVLVGGASGAFVAIALGVTGFYVGAGTIVSHIAAGALTPMGVEPFLDGRHYSFDLVRADNLLANYALLGIGGAAAVVAFLVGTAIGSVV